MNKLILLISVMTLFSYRIGESMAATCTWNGSKLTITGSGSETFSGCSDGSGHKSATEVTFGDGIKAISGGSFYHAKNLVKVNFGNISSIGSRAFEGTGITSFVIPATVTSIGIDAFRTSQGKEIIITDNSNMEEWSWDSFNDQAQPKETFVCIGSLDICQEKIKKFIDTSAGGTCSGSTGCMLGVKEIKLANEAQCKTAGDYYFNGRNCVILPEDTKNINCFDGYAKLKNNCVDPLKTFAKKRYTPAEAAQWLNENNNTVTLTFRK